MKYIANTPILHDGKRVEEGGALELDDEAAKRLGAKVTPVRAARPDPEKKTDPDKKPT